MNEKIVCLFFTLGPPLKRSFFWIIQIGPVNSHLHFGFFFSFHFISTHLIGIFVFILICFFIFCFSRLWLWWGERPRLLYMRVSIRKRIQKHRHTHTHMNINIPPTCFCNYYFVCGRLRLLLYRPISSRKLGLMLFSLFLLFLFF